MSNTAGGLRCSDESISWTSWTTSGIFKVEYTLDGTTWVTLADQYSGNTDGGNSYAWQLPDTLTSSIQYRVTDVEDITKTDESLVGSIYAPANGVQILSPNGSESFIAGTTQQINYEYGSSTTGVTFKIRYAEGGYWYNLTVNNDFADGSGTFTVPNRPTSSARIRIIGNQYNGCDYDESDQTFTIVSSVTVLQPNGGESWQATVGALDHGEDISFSNAERVVNNIRLIKSNSAENFTQTFYPDSPLNKLSIRFDNLYTYGANTIALNISGGSWYNTGASGEDLFNQVFTSTRTDGSITVSTSGSGNKSFLAHISSVGTDTREIKWNIIGTSNRFDIDYTMDNGSTWSPIVTNYPVYNNPSVGIYQWQVPNTPSTTAQVRVRDRGNPSNVVDISDANFTIQEAEPLLLLELLTQNNGEVYYHDQQQEIRWNNPDSFTQVGSLNIDLDYSINGGVTWTNIVTDYPNTGTYLWTIPEVNIPQNQSLIRVQETGNVDKFDISEDYITLRPRLSIISPNDNESLFQSCTESSITWYGGATTNYKIEISINNGVDWTLITNPNSAAYFNSFDWSIPNTPSESCLIKVSERDNPEYFDVSDYVFTIEPSITITSPVESQNIGSVNTVNISWDSSFTSDTYNIDYSVDFGTSWASIVEEQVFTTTSYDWDISGIDETIIYVRVFDFLNPCKDDIISFSLGLISDITISSDTIDENQNINSLVGEFSVNGTGSGNYVYELISGQGDTNNLSFSINDNKLNSNEQFDYESATSKSIRVSVTDQVSNEVFEKEFVIQINDLEDTNYPLGDCNGDFTVSVIDIVMLVDYISGQNPNGFLIANADVNQDGNINVLDIIGIVNIIMGNAGRDGISDNGAELIAEFYWNENQLLIESNANISGLQLEFDSYFDFNLDALIGNEFESTSYFNGDKYVVLIYSLNGQFLESGFINLLASISETPVINSINSIGADPFSNQINILFNESSLSTNNIIFKNNLDIFPNPTERELYFTYNEFYIETVDYIIYDALGRQVQKINKVINSNNDSIDLQLSSGVYNILIKIKLPSGEVHQAFEKFIMK